MAITHFKSYIRITDMNKPNQKLTTSIVITNVTNIHIKLFAEDIQQLKRGKIAKTKTKIVIIRSVVKEIRKKLRSEKYMGARRYEISLRVFNSIAHEWGVELNTRREISYLKVTMYYFFYHINIIIIDWLRMVKASQSIHRPDRVVQKASDVSAADWRFQTHVKKKMILVHICC